MHSMPAVTAAPNGKVVACQSLDNKIVIYQVGDRFKEMRKKVFKGHMVAGYACGVDFSPEMSYLASGDGDGKVCLVFTFNITFIIKQCSPGLHLGLEDHEAVVKVEGPR